MSEKHLPPQDKYYPLSLLPAGHVLVLNMRLRLLSYLAPSETTIWPYVFAQECFSANELRVLLPLLDHYPKYCPYEVVWVSFHGVELTNDALDQARRYLQDARRANAWDDEMKHLRKILTCVCFKLRFFSLEICAVLETGYLLTKQRHT